MIAFLLTGLMLLGTFSPALAVEAVVGRADVYGGGAWITCSFPAEEEMVLELPATLDRDSLSVTSRGAEVLHWTVEERPAPGWLPPALGPLRDEVDRARAQVQLLRARSAALRQAVGHLEKALPEARDGADLETFVDRAQRKREGLELRLLETADLEKTALSECEALEALLVSRRPEVESVLILSASTKGEGDVIVRGWSAHASWRPAYRLDLAASTGETRWRLDGLLSQRTGLPWRGEVAFHSGTPRDDLDLPELPPLVVDVAVPLRAAKRMEALSAAPSVLLDSYGNGGERRESTTDVVLTAEAETPGDGTEVRVELEAFSLTGRTDLTLWGELSPRAWLLWKADGLDRTLLAGQAELFVDGTPTGRTFIAERGAGQPLELPFGQSPLVKVLREEILPRQGSGWTGRGRLERGYRLVLSSGLARPQAVTLRDRLPVSANEKIKVESVEFSTEPTERDEEGRLSWELTLEGGASAEITVRYRLSYPGDGEIVFYGGGRP